MKILLTNISFLHVKTNKQKIGQTLVDFSNKFQYDKNSIHKSLKLRPYHPLDLHEKLKILL